ncbi:von Willebrand factor type A domain-containing protein [Flavobacteriaceae bacterium S356]|uniref:von Willebrand factor type A domain-containing protein n=1 Tax=Asprobacillus argus TaxID=3076534 RepID=A0ABU3LID2_9FLAO|nr:von Willebrand factor type A domain-containing protein [Flavobacteriaceae bacterium S356]
MIKKAITLLMLFGIMSIHGQKKEITGKVSDDSGGLPGASILVKGTTKGVQTDFDGRYAIRAELGDVLVFTYLGYKTVEKTIGVKSTINVKMEEGGEVLDEVVVLGYGTYTKKAITGSASVVRSQHIGNVLNGYTAGVKTNNRSKVVSKLRNRGPNEPLIIVNEEPYYGKLKALAKADIFASEVLKDSVAIARYGEAGKNGVVIIETSEDVLEYENTDEYEKIVENEFELTISRPLSTFSIDVDKASYSNIRRMLNNGQSIDPNAVKVEEMINYFDYQYPEPKGKHPFSIYTEFVKTPWNKKTKLLRIGLQGKTIPQDNLPASNLTFLIDVSGSMSDQNKLPLLKSAFKLLVHQLRAKDKVSIVVYAGAAGVVLESTSGNKKIKILEALNDLESGGSTAGGEGIKLAYKIAQQNFIKGGNNRVILATDGDFNVGDYSNEDMEKLIVEKRDTDIFLSVLGFGYGNYKDSKLEILADKGNGNHAYIDNMQEAQKVFGKEFGGTLHTIAKDVKIQLEFNPQNVKAYRLIGYENRLLNDEDFVDDTKDAGELGSGHSVTALYEVITSDMEFNKYSKKFPDLKYTINKTSYNHPNELLTVKFRYKKPTGKKSIELIHVKKNVLDKPSADMNFAASVAMLGMKLRKSKFDNNLTIKDIKKLSEKGRSKDREGYRAEFIRLLSLVK